MKSIFALAVTATAIALSAPADAALLTYELTGTDYDGSVEYARFSFDSDRVPDDVVDGVGFAFYDLPGVYTYGSSTITLDDIYFYSADYDGGIFSSSTIVATDGPQLYSGPESSPTFLTGTFALTDYYSGAPLTLTVTAATAAVPEAATWALMLGGFAAIGGTMRRRRTATALA